MKIKQILCLIVVVSGVIGNGVLFADENKGFRECIPVSHEKKMPELFKNEKQAKVIGALTGAGYGAGIALEYFNVNPWVRASLQRIGIQAGGLAGGFIGYAICAIAYKKYMKKEK
jgi:hypothetical protein